jgi:PhnB protein
MARVSTYLNFMGTTEEAFRFYASVFGTEITEPIMRLTDGPAMPGAPELSEAEKNLVMHIEVPILCGHVLQGTDVLASMGHTVVPGNNVTISLEPDTRAETMQLFEALSAGSTDAMPPQEMFWGALWGTCVDRYGIRWMFNCAEPAAG